MQDYDHRSQGYSSKEGGALQAAYLEKVTRKNSGFLRRLLDKTIAPASQSNKENNRVEDWKKQTNNVGGYGSSVPSALRSQAGLNHSEGVMTKPSTQSNPPTKDPIISSHASSLLIGENEQASSHMISSSSEAEEKEMQEYLETNHCKRDGNMDQDMLSPPSMVSPTDPDETTCTSRPADSRLQSEPISPIESASIQPQPPDHKLKVSVSRPPPMIKEFTAQRLPRSNDIEAHSGLLQAHMLECALQKHSLPHKKTGWLKKTG